MRPTSRPQSALRYPLNHILGTEANVRVLRVIFTSDIPIGVAELARVTELQATGVARVCNRLEDLGVIQAVGRGDRNRQYRKSPRFPLHTLSQLFVQEHEVANQTHQEIRNAVGNAMGTVRAAWIEGPVAEGKDRPEDPVIVGVLAEPKDVEAARDAVWQHLMHVQSNRDITIDLRVQTEADLRTSDKERIEILENALSLVGSPPAAFTRKPAKPEGTTSKTAARSHRDLDARSRDVAQMVADLIRRDPSVVEDARRDLERAIPTASPRERLELEEWQGILSTMSIPRLRRFLVDDSQRATRLRQSLPFLKALRDKDRTALHPKKPK